jgi:hypothetical protein
MRFGRVAAGGAAQPLRHPGGRARKCSGRERLFEPVEKLGGGIDLVVMLAVGEDGHLVEVFGGRARGRSAGRVTGRLTIAGLRAAVAELIPPRQALVRQFDDSGGSGDVGAKAGNRGSVGAAIGRRRQRGLADLR